MVTELKGLGMSVLFGMEEAVMKSGVQYQYDDGTGRDGIKRPLKRMKVLVTYNKVPGGAAVFEVTDTKTGKEETFTLQHPFLSSKMITAIEQRDTRTVRALKKMQNGNDFQDLILEEWKNGRGLHQDVPTKAAMLLLSGLRRGVPAPLVATKDGTAYSGGRLIRSLRDANLMDLRVSNGKKPRYETNLRGHEVLQAWALKNKLFMGYLEAFRPEGWEDRAKAQMALRAMHSGAYEPNHYSTVGAPV